MNKINKIELKNIKYYISNGIIDFPLYVKKFLTELKFNGYIFVIVNI